MAVRSPNKDDRPVLSLAPLERECMQTLWPLGQGTVRQIRDELARTRPRAYTTIMTIMNRLAQKGVVARSKVGRAYLYRPNLTAEQARAHAVEQLVAHFFEGSTEALLAQLGEEAPEDAAARRTKPRAKEEAVPAAPIDESLL